MYIVMIWWLQNRKEDRSGWLRRATWCIVRRRRVSWCRHLRSGPSANWCRAKRLWAKWENYTFRGGISCSCWGAFHGAAAITSAWRRGRLAARTPGGEDAWLSMCAGQWRHEGILLRAFNGENLWYFHVVFVFSLSSYISCGTNVIFFPSSNFSVCPKTIIYLIDSDFERKEIHNCIQFTKRRV